MAAVDHRVRERPGGWPRRRWIPALAFGALALLLTFDPKLYINGDNVDYMFLARALRSGDLWPSDKYPPLFPALLAPVQALFGLRLIPQKILVLAFACGALWLFARIVRRRLGDAAGPWFLAAASTLIPVVEYSHYVMSEVPFLFFFLGAIDACDRLAARRAGPGGAGGPPPTRRLGEIALWLAASFYTRTAGLALWGAILLALAAGRRARQAAILAAMLAALALPWLIRSAATEGGNPYFAQLLQVNPYYPEFGALDASSLWRRVSENARFYFAQQIPVTVLPAAYRSTYSVPEVRDFFYPLGIALPLLAPLALGLVRGLRGRDPGAYGVLIMLVVCCVWPLIWAGSRFLVPLVPLLLLYWFGGFGPAIKPGQAWTWKRSGAWTKVRWSLLALLLFLGIRNLVFYAQETRRYPPEWEHYFAALAWIRENTPPEAVVVDRKPGFVEYVAARKAVSFPREADPDRMLESFRSRKATHVVLSSLPYDDIGRYLQPALDARRDFFTLLLRLADPYTYVLQFHPSGKRSPPGP